MCLLAHCVCFGECVLVCVCICVLVCFMHLKGFTFLYSKLCMCLHKPERVTFHTEVFACSPQMCVNKFCELWPAPVA